MPLNKIPEDLVSFTGEFLKKQGITKGNVNWIPLRPDGSDRVFFRLSHPRGSFILAINERPAINQAGVNENDSFLYLNHHLRSKGIALPAIYHYRIERGWFILEDLGDVHLDDEVLHTREHPHQKEKLYRKVLAILPLIQVKGAQGLNASRIHNIPYNSTFARQWESGYFFRAFLKGYCNLAIEESYLADELDSLADTLSTIDNSYFLYRDFQSKNIMLKNDQLRFIDFQGGRKGPLQYDLASLLIDPYVDLEEELQERLMGFYLQELKRLVPINEKDFIMNYPPVAIHRNMQILGAFAHLTLVKQKKHFERYIPIALASLKKLLHLDIFSSYKKLRKVVEPL